MDQRSRTRALGLWMNGDFVGTWHAPANGSDALQYDRSWVSSRQGRPLSNSLPITPGNAPHRGAAVRAYFDNLLPDTKDIRERVARRFKTPSTDAFDLLAQTGRDCVGALQILPDGVQPTDVMSVQATPLNPSEVAKMLRGAVAPPGMGAAEEDEDDFRISIAGAQEKTALLYFEGRWCRPHGTTPTSHILKLPMGLVGNMKLDLGESIENEWLCLAILRAYGLPVANCEPLKFEDMKVLSVERFDRAWATTGNGTPWLVRLPQEDMCQATGTPPHMKYETDGGPGIDRIMNLLDYSQQTARDRLTFFQAQILFWMLCAPDGHAKNFSLFLQSRGAYALTPLYDVLSALPLLGAGRGKLSPFKMKMAMAVRSKNAHWRMRDIQRRHWVALGERHGVISTDGRDAASVIDELVARTPAVISGVRKLLPRDFPQALADSILQGLHAAAERLAA